MGVCWGLCGLSAHLPGDPGSPEEQQAFGAGGKGVQPQPLSPVLWGRVGDTAWGVSGGQPGAAQGGSPSSSPSLCADPLPRGSAGQLPAWPGAVTCVSSSENGVNDSPGSWGVVGTVGTHSRCSTEATGSYGGAGGVGGLSYLR